jgi:DNA adenine methylase
MDYSKQSREQLIALCKEKKVKGYSGKKKEDLLALLQAAAATAPVPAATPLAAPAPVEVAPYALEKEKPYLKAFLDKHRSPKGFKRIQSSILRYAGGKTKAIGLILDNLPALKQKKIVSPFFGGGSFELAVSTHLGFEVVGYDVFGVLTNFWTQAIEHPKELATALSTMKPTQEEYTRNRHILLHFWETIKPADLYYETKNRLALTEEEKARLTGNPLLQAAYYYYNMQLSYGPMFLGWPSSVYLKEGRYKEILEKMKAFKPGNVKVSTASFETAIRNHPNDFLFLDPPYYLGGDSKMFKGMYPNCNFAIHHNGFNHALLAELLKTHRGGFFVTYNDCPEIREMYKDFRQIFPSWQYTYGQGEKRIGKNREEGTKNNIKESHEIFIICPPLD